MTVGLSTREAVINEQELQRQAKHRLAILRHAEEVSGNVAATCRYYGISRTRFYRWRRRYDEEGLAGLKDKSRRSALGGVERSYPRRSETREQSDQSSG